jgi:hypothetical protein
MSEALVPTQRARLPVVRNRRSGLSALEALEQGFALFRSTFGRDAWRYYVGATPLVACFIPMWVVNGQILISNGALLGEAALLTGAYLFRVWMIGSYMQRVEERAFNKQRPKTASLAARAAGGGRLLAWKILLTAGALLTLPTVAGSSWFYNACQFATLEAQANGGEKHSFTGCLALASQWFGGSLLLFMMLVPLWSAVFLNGLIVAIVVPQLLHSILGVDTLLSTSVGIYALLQSSALWIASFAGAWLALDPVVKCTFIIVYQHLRSRREGDDLLGVLASLPREQQKKAQLIVPRGTGLRVMNRAFFVLGAILLSLSLTTTARAAQTPRSPGATETPSSSVSEVRIERLRQALNNESQRAMYRWHDAAHPSPPTWFDKLLLKNGSAIGRAWNALWNFLHKLWPSRLNALGGQARTGWSLKDLRLWLTILAILTLVTGAVLYWLRRGREPTSISAPLEVVPLQDLTGSVVASERSEDEWFALASRLERAGELRTALRAAYLGLLAGLAQREWLTIRRDRTNREYLNEFTRRWRRRPQAAVEGRAEVPEQLGGSLRQFDLVWYGSHPVTPEAVSEYRQHQREFLSHV